MANSTGIFLGFDPGGKKGEGKFGWSICCPVTGANKLKVIRAGVGKNAKEVFDDVISELESRNLREKVRAAGIDAPLFWHKTGEDREIDKLIRRKLPVGKKNELQVANKNSVMAINSLLGADLVQGVLLGYHLHHGFSLSITESHPGALDYLDKSMRDRILCLPSDEHKRDATFAAYAAWHIGAPEWQDLFLKEPEAGRVVPLETPVSYWMPIK